jgi:mannonate dehydratase
MKISNARVIVTSPGRNFVTLKIETDDGLTGIGDATLNGRELAVASYLTDHVIPVLIGRDAHRIEDTWQYLYRGAYWRRGPVTMSAIAAVDTALWDLKAKSANLPLYQLLGGKSREGVMVYGHANGNDIAETLDEVARYIGLGYRAIRAQCGIPGLASTYGVAKDKLYYEPADAAIPTENLWSTTKYLDHVPKLFDAIRARFGFDPHILHDIHHRLTPIEAGRLGKSLEPYRLFWMEDPTPAENQAGFRLIRQHTVTPIAVGEVFNTIHDCQQLITEQLIDYIRTTVVHAGGSPICGESRIWPSSTMCAPAVTERPTCRPSAWGPRCISTPGYTISASRSTCGTPTRPMRFFRMRISFAMGICMPATRPDMASTSMKSLRRAIPTSRVHCR